jgi:hypothetical protein
MGRLGLEGLEKFENPDVDVNGFVSNPNAPREASNRAAKIRTFHHRFELIVRQVDLQRRDDVRLFESTAASLDAQAITERVGELLTEGF